MDWLSVALGNIHGAISGLAKSQKKLEARLNIDHLQKLGQVTNVPLVLHGGSGIQKDYMMRAVKQGISKINIGTTTRQAFEGLREESMAKALQKVYEVTVGLVTEELESAGSAATVLGTAETA